MGLSDEREPSDGWSLGVSFRTIFIIPQLEHQFVQRLRVLRQAESTTSHTGRETEVGQRSSHDVECRMLIASFQQPQKLGHFNERSWPWTVLGLSANTISSRSRELTSVAKKQRNSVLVWTGLMHNYRERINPPSSAGSSGSWDSGLQ